MQVLKRDGICVLRELQVTARTFAFDFCWAIKDCGLGRLDFAEHPGEGSPNGCRASGRWRADRPTDPDKPWEHPASEPIKGVDPSSVGQGPGLVSSNTCWCTVSRYSAAVCMRGHYRDTILELRQQRGEVVENFCSKCGAPVITACPNCSSRLLGAYEGVIAAGPDEPEKFCSSCGAPYPWADRASLIMQLRNILEFEPGLDDAGRLEIAEEIAVLSEPKEESKRRVRAGEALKGLAPKGWGAAQPILQTLISAELRKQLGLPPV